MVYINENSGSITIPRHTFTCSGNGYNLILTSNLCNEVLLVRNGNNISTNSLYYKFELYNLTDLNVGEYTYKLICDDVVLEWGLLTFGNYQRTVIVNNTFNTNKIQYNG